MGRACRRACRRRRRLCGRRWGGWLESRAKLGPRIERLKAGEKETPDSHWQCPATHTHAIKMTTDEPGNHAPARPRIAIVGPPADKRDKKIAGGTAKVAAAKQAAAAGKAAVGNGKGKAAAAGNRKGKAKAPPPKKKGK